MSATVEVACKWCKQSFTARTADRKRGWARFCSKTCKASEQKFGHSKSYWEKANPVGHTSNLAKYAARLMRSDDFDELGDISDMDFGASDGGGYESIN